MRVILLNVKPDDFILAIRAVRWLIERPEHKSSVIAYGEGDAERWFFVARNKASITVRPN